MPFIIQEIDPDAKFVVEGAVRFDLHQGQIGKMTVYIDYNLIPSNLSVLF